MTTTEDAVRTILIRDIFVERDADAIASDESLRQELGLDSIGFIELKMQVEQSFGITIKDDDFTPENFATIASLARLIDRCRVAVEQMR